MSNFWGSLHEGMTSIFIGGMTSATADTRQMTSLKGMSSVST